MFILKKGTRLSQSPIILGVNYRDPITKDLVFLASSTGTNMRDIVSGRTMTNVNNPVSGVNRKGSGLVTNTSGNASHAWLPITGLNTNGRITLVATFRTLTAGTDRRVLALGNSANSNPILAIASDATNSTALRLYSRGDSGGGNTAATALGSITPFDGRETTVVVVFEPTRHAAWADGVLIGENTGISLGASTFDRIAVGGLLRATIASNMHAIINMVAVFNNAISDDLAAKISLNPWKLFAEPRISLPILTSISRAHTFGLRRGTRLSQPYDLARINYENPSTKGLITALVALPKTRVGVDLINKKSGTFHYNLSAHDIRLGRSGGYFWQNTIYDDVGASLSNSVNSIRAGASIVDITSGTQSSDTTVWYAFSPGSASDGISLYVKSTNVLEARYQLAYAGAIQYLTASTPLSIGCHVLSWAYVSGVLGIYDNGELLASVTTTPYWGAASVARVGPRNYGSPTHGSGIQVSACYAWDRLLTDREVSSIGKNPWQLIEVNSGFDVPYVETSVTVYRPGTDEITSSWVATPGPSFYNMLNESVASNTEYITSPGMATPTPITLTWDSPVPIGTWQANIQLKQETLSGSQVRIVFLDASNTVVGTSSWISATGTFTTHNVTVTTTDISTKFRLEIQ